MDEPKEKDETGCASVCLKRIGKEYRRERRRRRRLRRSSGTTVVAEDFEFGFLLRDVSILES